VLLWVSDTAAVSELHGKCSNAEEDCELNVNLKMPDLATNEGVELGIIRWLVEPGQPVKRGQVLLEVETDKATQDVECTQNGILKSIHVNAGEKADVGTVIATIEVV
jgi:pyruvate/2-oxoglutarate dehydrogenase complex dihydrolipoamide acyltransferase (E2) component